MLPGFGSDELLWIKTCASKSCMLLSHDTNKNSNMVTGSVKLEVILGWFELLQCGIVVGQNQ